MRQKPRAVIMKDRALVYLNNGRVLSIVSDEPGELESLVLFFTAPMGFNSCAEYEYRCWLANADTLEIPLAC